MSEFLPVKSIYTGADVTALGEATPDDVMLAPGGGIKYPDGSVQLTAPAAGAAGTLVEETPPAATPTTLWFESDSGRMYLKYKNPDDAEVWVEANVAGVRGQTGPAGADGADGADGVAGPAGADGAVGPQGPAGADGVAGPAGADGAPGIQGEVGPQGPAGADGAAGIQGPAGLDGAVGPQGPAGLDGAVGPQGPAGANGLDSQVPGPQGPGGPEGPMGPQGPAGPADWNAIPNKPSLYDSATCDARFLNDGGDVYNGEYGLTTGSFSAAAGNVGGLGIFGYSAVIVGAGSQWSITTNGSNKLYFAFNGVAVFSIDSAGNMQSQGSHTPGVNPASVEDVDKLKLELAELKAMLATHKGVLNGNS
jgi:hypothetical protein